MGIVILAVLLSVIQTSSPVPRKAPDPNNRTAQNVAKNPNNDKAPTQQTPSVVQSISTAPDKNGSHGPATENTQKPITISELPSVSVTKDWWDRTYIIFTGILIAVGILGIRAAYKTLGEIKAQREAMQGQLTTMQGQLTQATQQTQELKAAADIALVAAQAAIENAKAAKVSADIAAGVAIPKLVVHEISAGNAGTAALTAMLQLPSIKLVVKNYGQTPALLRSWSILFTCEKELPEIPVYDGQRGCGIVLTNEVIQPNQPYTLTVDHHWNRQQFSLDDIKAIIDHRRILNAYGYVCYRDIFGNPLQRFKFFATALNMGDGWIDWRTETAPDAYAGTDRLPYKEVEQNPKQAN